MKRYFLYYKLKLSSTLLLLANEYGISQARISKILKVANIKEVQ